MIRYVKPHPIYGTVAHVFDIYKKGGVCPALMLIPSIGIVSTAGCCVLVGIYTI